MRDFIHENRPALVLAPMQDVTDLPFMRVIARRGAPDWFVTEYFRVHPGSKLHPYIQRSIVENATDRPIFAQMIGSDVDSLVRTAGELAQLPVAGIDLNLGCPAPIVCRKNAGGGLLPIRAWPVAYYTALAKALCELGYAVGIIGLPEDQVLAHTIQAECGHVLCLNFVGYTKNLEALTRLFFHSDLLITNDGGPGHFASLTPIRTLMFFGPETSALYGPLTPRATVLESHAACSPCLTAYNHRATPCDGDNQCLKRIEPTQVLELAMTQLALCEPRDPAYV